MHWIASNWFTVLVIVYAVASEVMPLLPNKAQTVVGAILEIVKAVVAKKTGKQLTEEEPK